MNLIQCSDGAHGITIEQWPAGEIDGDAVIGFWYLGFQKRTTFWNRIRLAWRILREHSIIFDELCISRDNIQEIVKELEKIRDQKK